MDARVDRSRQIEVAAAIASLRDEDDPRSGIFVGQTTAIDKYPTKAGVYYGITAVDVGGDEDEGSQADLTLVGDPFLALHVGSTAPPAETNVIVHPVGLGKYAFNY